MVTLFVKNHMFFNQLIKNQGKYGPNLETLLRFCDLVEAGGNKAAAARKIKATPSRGRSRSALKDIENDLATAVKNLEKTFGVELTHSTGKGVVEVTPAGKRLYHVLLEYSAALESVAVDAEAMPDHLNIACSAGGFIDWQWNPRYEAIKENFPNVKFSTVSSATGRLVEMIREAKIDLGVMDADRVPQDLDNIRLSTVRFAMFIPRRLLGRKKPTRQNISNLPLAGLVGEGKYMKSLGEASIRDGYDLKFDSFFGGFPQMFTSLVSGKFAAVLPEVAGHGLMLDNIIILKDLEFLKALDRVNAIVWNKRLAAFRQYLPHAADAIKKALKTPLP